jgi:hypothetical protein
MSEVEHIDLDSLPRPICDYCGGRIETLDQQCPALDDGRCSP